jgi:hypothetical protein
VGQDIEEKERGRKNVEEGQGLKERKRKGRRGKSE